MDKIKIKEIKKGLVALALVGTILITTGCEIKRDEYGVPIAYPIHSSYSKVDDYSKYVMKDGEAVKMYNSENVYILFNHSTYRMSEYLYNAPATFWGGCELYDLESGKMLAYCDGFDTTYNRDYYEYIVRNSYQVCLKDVCDYVEGHEKKDYYSLDEIRELEPQILESVKSINAAKKAK